MSENDSSLDDAFNEEDNAIIQTIVLMRIYDALIALLQNSNPDIAQDLLQAHLEGLILGPAPYFTGQFLTEER